MRLITIAICLMTFIFSGGLPAQEKKPDKKPDPVFETVVDDPKLPRVLLIGDSISMGYTLPVREMLAGVANVHRIPENGGPTTTGLLKIEQWLRTEDDKRWDVIHFNWGLHDIKLTGDRQQVLLHQYEHNLRHLVKKLHGTNAKLIWASTTPVPEGKVSPLRKNEDVIRYNAVAKKIMEEEEVVINDLYQAAWLDLKSWQQPVNVHFTSKGSRALGELVSRSIRERLSEKK